VFALYCTTGLSVGTIVQVTPPTQSVAAGAQVQFDAAVLNNANPNVSWSVDGNMGGNITVGTVDATGNYNAPDTAGTHEITATSVADPTASGSATVTVWGTVYDPENIIVVGDTPVTVDGNQIDVA